jgi:hypothetical protein
LREGNNHRNHAALPREVEVETRADAALIKGLPAPDGGHRRRGNQTEARQSQRYQRSSLGTVRASCTYCDRQPYQGTANNNQSERFERNGSLRQRATANELCHLRLSPERFCDDR